MQVYLSCNRDDCALKPERHCLACCNAKQSVGWAPGRVKEAWSQLFRLRGVACLADPASSCEIKKANDIVAAVKGSHGLRD